MESPQERPGSSRKATLSLAFGLGSWGAWLLDAPAFGLVITAGNLEVAFDADAAGYALGLASLIVFPLAMLLALVSLILGVRALMRREPRRAAAVAGLVMSTLCLLPSVMLIVYVASINGGVELPR